MSSSPESLFAEFLDLGTTEDAPDFETWVRAYPEVKDELRRIHADWRLLGAMRKKGVSFFKSGEHERPQPAPGLEAPVVSTYCVDTQSESVQPLAASREGPLDLLSAGSV